GCCANAAQRRSDLEAVWRKGTGKPGQEGSLTNVRCATSYACVYVGAASDRLQAGELHRAAQAGAHDVEQQHLLLRLLGLAVVVDRPSRIIVDDRACAKSLGQQERNNNAARSIEPAHHTPPSPPPPPTASSHPTVD